MILATCVLGPWVTERYGRRVATQVRLPDRSSAVEGERIMLAVGRAESVELLSDVAVMLRAKNSQEPIMPLYVVQDGVNVDERIARGERVLAKVVAHVVAADVPVSPVSRIDVNVPEGVLHALKEWHVSTLVMGSSRYETNVQSLLFGVYDKVRDESHQLLFLCRMVHRLNIDARLILIVPALMERQSGFTQALGAILRLVSANKLTLHVLTAPETGEAMTRELKHYEGAIAWSADTIKEWRSLIQRVKECGVSGQDTVIFMMSRPGHLAWQASLDRAYRQLLQEYPQNNMMMVHPFDTEDRPHESPPPEGGVAPIPHSERDTIRGLSRPALALEDPSAAKAVERLLADAFGEQTHFRQPLAEKLLSQDAIPLGDGMMLFHTHCDGLAIPVILLAVHSTGFRSAAWKDSARAIFVLLSPKDQVATHLQALAQVARLAHAMAAAKKQERD